jgi:hypothetical protein
LYLNYRNRNRNRVEITTITHLLLNDPYKLRESENKQNQDKLTQLTVEYSNFIIKSNISKKEITLINYNLF